MKNIFLLLLITYSSIAQTENGKVSLTLHNPKKVKVAIYAYDAMHDRNDTLLATKGDSLVKRIIDSSSPRFVTMRIGDRMQSLYLASTYNLRIYLNESKIFDGWGSDINNYLNEYHSFLRSCQYKHVIVSQLEPYNFFDAMNDFDNQFKRFHEYAIKRNKITDERVEMLENMNKMRILSLKANRYTAWHDSEDSTIQRNLQKIDSEIEQVFNDAHLLKLYVPSYLDALDGYILMGMINAYKKASNTSYHLVSTYTHLSELAIDASIKEFLLAKTVYRALDAINKSTVFNDLYNQFADTYPKSTYLAAIERKTLDYAGKMLAKNREAPNFNGFSRDGEKVELKGLRGKPVLVNVWASWCRPCMAQKPTIEALQKKFTQVRFLYVSVDINKDNWLKTLKTSDTANTINMIQTEEETNLFWKNYVSLGIPRYIIIDSTGKIVNAKVSLKEVESILARL
jgi:thiol-disulfide isomerase/thioredoxin